MFDSYRLRMAATGSYDGESRRKNSQKIMDASWMRDPATKPVYVKWVQSGLPIVDDDDEVLYAKYNVKSYHNITGDEIAYLLQFRLEDIKQRSDIKVGSYVQIRNELNEPEWWLIIHYDDRTQFRQFSIIKCLWVYKWVSHKDGKRVIHQCLGAPRKQNSYNSGEWLDYTFQIVENQHVAIMPSNDDANTIGYETKFLISNEGRYPPLAWNVSKVQPSINGAVTSFTMTQEQFNPAKDNAELMIADYYDSYETPELPEMEEVPTVSNFEITCSGKSTVRAGGGYKKFCLQERIGEELVKVTDPIKWYIGETIVNDDTVANENDNSEWKIDFGEHKNCLICLVEGNVFKVKCTNEYSLIGETFTITASSERGSKSIIVEVISL